jgi:hypothetical protein
VSVHPGTASSDDASTTTGPAAGSRHRLRCPVCTTAFEPKGRQRYCGDACRHTAYRRRHRQPPAVVPAARSRRDATIYECPDCDARFVGIQYCSDCHSFARRLGPGGACPCCGEAVLVADLLTN